MINPYARRDYETMTTWHDRLLTCPILEGEALSLVAWLSGARLEDLERSRQIRRIVRDEFARDMANETEQAVDDALDEYF